MLTTIRLREIYVEIQNQLFYLIPEKWSKICLYASVIKQLNNLETGEMFFYYFPKGMLKKNPVNVYEVPTKFNVNEKDYLILVDKLYETIKKLIAEFKRNNHELWSNLTIIIENSKFTIKYNYEDLLGSKYSSYDRHIIWKYEYLNMPIEIVSRKDRKMLESYFEEKETKNMKVEEYSEGMYNNKTHNIIEYNKQQNAFATRQKEAHDAKNSISIIERKTKKDKYELHKMKVEKEKSKSIENEVKKQESKNQILNFH